MAKKTEVTLEDKLRALYDLQLIDSRVDEIRNVRGELPLEVEDLENEIAGVESRLESFQKEVSDFDFQTKEQKNKIEVAKEEHKKYEKNLKNVRNNREYNSIVKEQEFQELEIQLAEKRIKEFISKKELKQEAIEQLTEKVNERKTHLKAKNEKREGGPKWPFGSFQKFWPNNIGTCVCFLVTNIRNGQHGHFGLLRPSPSTLQCVSVCLLVFSPKGKLI